jgi:hypothetical protein
MEGGPADSRLRIAGPADLSCRALEPHPSRRVESCPLFGTEIGTVPWCGGQIGLLCATIGEQDSLHQAYSPKVPADRRAYLLRLFTGLGGELIPKIDYTRDNAETHARERNADKQRGISELTIGALRVLQLEEALGTTPTLKQFGTSAFQRYASRVWKTGSVDDQWVRYVTAVQQALSTDAVPTPLPAPRASRPPVTLREVESGPTEPREMVVSHSEPTPEHHGFLGRHFAHGASGERSTQPPESPPGYVLHSEGPSDVVGESYYQEALEATRALLRYDRELGRPVFDALLLPEPDNPTIPRRWLSIRWRARSVTSPAEASGLRY